MNGAVRLILAGVKSDMAAFLRKGLTDRTGVEMVVNVENCAAVENKLDRRSLNVLLTDVDSTVPDAGKLRGLGARFKLLSLFTSVAHSRAAPYLSSGTDDFLLKPALFTPNNIPLYVMSLCKRMDGFRNQAGPLSARDFNALTSGSKKVVGIASSTGGTNALEALFKALPADTPPVVAVQHMPSGFTRLFADRVNAMVPLTVREAATGDYLRQGTVLMAPPDKHMKLVRQQGRLAVECFIGAKMHGVMPAADVLFESIAELVRDNAVGVILTGMGADGARGLLLMHNMGARTIGQDQATSVVYGMPKVAKDLNALDFVLPLPRIAGKIVELARA